jgi:hypothetical protein
MANRICSLGLMTRAFKRAATPSQDKRHFQFVAGFPVLSTPVGTLSLLGSVCLLGS